MKNKLKTKIIIIYTTCLLFIISTAHICIAEPLPVYGQALFEDGDIAEGAFVNVTSDKGYLTTTVDYGGYWQVDCGDPKNWPLGTPINIKINIIKNGKTWLGEKNSVIDSKYVNTGTIILYSTENDVSNIKPVANITLDQSYKYFVGESIVFDGSNSYDSDGEIIEYKWVFTKNEDSYTIKSSIPKISHIFTEPGLYNIELQVKDDREDIDIVTDTINISNDPTVVDIICDKTGNTYQNITFEAKILKDIIIINYTWDFDDDTCGYNKKIDHIYKSSGTYFVKLIVKDNENNKYYTSKEIIIDTDSDNDHLSDNLEERIGSSIYTSNDYIDISINGNEHIIIDTNNDTKYDIFYNQTNNKTSNLKLENDDYLIDDDIDGKYDYKYNTTKETLTKYIDDSSEKNNDKNKEEEQETPGFSIILILGLIVIMILLYKKINDNV